MGAAAAPETLKTIPPWCCLCCQKVDGLIPMESWLHFKFLFFFFLFTGMHETSKRLSQTLSDIYESDWDGVKDLAVITEVGLWCSHCFIWEVPLWLCVPPPCGMVAKCHKHRLGSDCLNTYQSQVRPALLCRQSTNSNLQFGHYLSSPWLQTSKWGNKLIRKLFTEGMD